jgi:hypothetical protein
MITLSAGFEKRAQPQGNCMKERASPFILLVSPKSEQKEN